VVSPAYILRSPHTLSLPGARHKLAHAIRGSGRGVQVVKFHGLGASPMQPMTDQQYNASADSPGTMGYMRVDTVQCALNAKGANPRLTVDDKWGPRTAAALSAFIHQLNANLQPPASMGTYVYTAPPAGAGLVSITNALGDALTAEIDPTQCIINATMNRTPSVPTNRPAVAPPATMPSATSSGGTDWTMWGIAAAGVVAAGAVGYAVMKRRGRHHKKGRR